MRSRHESDHFCRLSRHLCAAGLVAASMLAMFAATGCPAAPAPGITNEEVLKYLDQTADWYRRALDVDWSPINSEEVLYRRTVQQTAGQAFRLGVTFAKAEVSAANTSANAAGSSTAPTTAPSGSDQRSRNLAVAVTTAVQTIAQIHSELDAIARAESETSATSRPTLDARRDKLLAQLRLTNARRDVLQSLIGFNSDREGSSAAALAQQIEDLANSLPQSTEDGKSPSTQPSSAAAEASANQEAFHAESSGILGLLSEMLALSRQMKELDSMAKQAEGLRQQNDKFRTPIRSQLMDAIHRSDAIAKAPDSDDPAVLNGQRQELDGLTIRFGQLSAQSVPLSEQYALISATRSSLQEWRTELSRAYSNALRYLLIRLGIMTAAVILLLVVSSVWRRATFRYIAEPRRRVQFLMIRRIVVGFILVLIVIASVVTEFGSLATFAGILTAGVALALQTFIVSGVAYFFFIGRFGVRVGDRVTVQGITGDVIEIGLFRLYLMELAGVDQDRHPTGRIVFFSNSVLFQPSAFFKQIPGADYTWQKVALTFTPDTEFDIAEAQLMAAVESVFADYRRDILRQHEAIEESVHIQLADPKPQGRLRLTETGLEFEVRFPVDSTRANEITDRITRALLDLTEKDPKLKLLSNAPLKS